jgi:S-adenosylmethionine decarboxylase
MATTYLQDPRPFGYLFTLDLYECKEGVCDDISLCYQFLEDLVAELKMRKQSPPFLFRSDSQRFPDKAGLSGWVPLIESGVQIHTLSPKRFISIDIYSCRRFDTQHLSRFVQGYFSPELVETNYILRGTKYNVAGTKHGGDLT